MTKSLDFLVETAHLISGDFELEMPRDLQQNVDQYATLKHWLSTALAHKIAFDLEGLFQVLYRLDVEESKAMQALNNQTIEPPAEALATLIIEREMKKVESRNWYSQRPRYTANVDPCFEESEVAVW